MITFTCQHCRSALLAREADRGKTVACPYCGRPLVVPAASTTAAPVTQDIRPDATSIQYAPTLDARPPARKRAEVGGLTSALLAAGATVGFCFVCLVPELFLQQRIAIADKFVHRGWTPYVAVFLASWSLVILIRRYLMVRRRTECLAVEFIPASARFDSDGRIAQVITQTQMLSQQMDDQILGPRIRRALEHYRASRNVREVGEILAEESEADFNAMVAAYALVRVFLWTIPILGFIGTVIGVGSAVGGFGEFLSAAQEIDEIKNALTRVTVGLGVAFDTTFVGLSLSVLAWIFA